MEDFKNYDFDNDEGWQNYLLNLTIPADKAHLLIKYKAKYYKREVDPDFDASLVSSSAEQKKSSTAQPASAPTSNAETTQPRQRPNASTKPTTREEQPQQTSARSTAQQQQPSSSLAELAMFIGNVSLVLCVMVSLAPLVNRRLAFSAYFTACRISTFLHLARIITKFGRPSLSGLRAYTQQAGTTTDFFYFVCSIMAANNPHMWLVTLPMAILAAYHASAYAHKHYSNTTLWKQYGQLGHTWLTLHKQDSLQFMAVLEILTLVHAFVGIFKIGFKGMIVAYMYSTRLRVRLWAPDTRQYHVFAWNTLGEKAGPVLRAVPMLQTFVSRGQTWFNTTPRQHQS